jgi:RNA polymerase sigma factor (sigma-70 family)
MTTEEVSEDRVQSAVVSFDAFYSQSWGEVYRAVAVGVGEPDLAREAVDEAMTRAFERWPSVSVMANPEGWVYRVAVNWARSILRRRQVALRKRFVPDPSADLSDPPDPELTEAIRNLPSHQRDVLVARFLLDMSVEDTAEAFGIPDGTVKSRISRALTTLREDLS